MKKTTIVFAVSLIALAVAFAQTLPVADGTASPGEYARVEALKDMNFHYTISPDGSTAYLALVAPTKGWVSIGLGSRKMDGLLWCLAWTRREGDDIGGDRVKHRHNPNPTKRLVAEAVKESGNATTLEFAVPLAGLARDGSLEVLVAYGRKDNLRSYHAKYASTVIQLK
jgi:hypothetical protein